ncbi:hypothetical protein [Oceanobacillus rekensis]|nr:hypothetical protein [Oceanobacillus rekensis]
MQNKISIITGSANGIGHLASAQKNVIHKSDEQPNNEKIQE